MDLPDGRFRDSRLQVSARASQKSAGNRLYTRAQAPGDSAAPVQMRRPSRQPARARGRARRRLRYLRRLRELQLRDAGGLVFDLYRFGERREALVRAKFDAIIATDKEIRALEELLGTTGDRVLEIRAPGIGGRCSTCGAFHGSDASFCATCGTDVARPPAPAVQPAPPPTAGELAPEEVAPEESAPSEETGEPAPPTEVVAAESSPPEDTVVHDVEAAAPEVEEVAPEEAPAVEETPPAEEAPTAEETPTAEEIPAPEDEPSTPPEAVESNGAGPRADDGEIAAVGPRRGQRSQSRPRRQRGSSR